MRRWILLALAACLFSIGPALGQEIAPDRVSLIAVIANPAAYEGRRITLTGYLNLEFEGNALYLGKADFDAFVPANAIWIDTDLLRRDPAEARRLSRRYVRVEGVFTATGHGHMGAYSGELQRISRLSVLPTRGEYELMYPPPFWALRPVQAVLYGLLVLLATMGGFWLGNRIRR